MTKFNAVVIFLILCTFSTYGSCDTSADRLNDAVDRLLRELKNEKGDTPVAIDYKGTSYEKRIGPLIFSYEIAMKVTRFIVCYTAKK